MQHVRRKQLDRKHVRHSQSWAYALELNTSVSTTHQTLPKARLHAVHSTCSLSTLHKFPMLSMFMCLHAIATLSEFHCCTTTHVHLLFKLQLELASTRLLDAYCLCACWKYYSRILYKSQHACLYASCMHWPLFPAQQGVAYCISCSRHCTC